MEILELVSKAWQENKTRVILSAAPIIILLLAGLVMKGYRSYLLASAKKLLENSTRKNRDLSTEAERADAQAELLKAEADRLAKKGEEIKGDDDPDWNKKV